MSLLTGSGLVRVGDKLETVDLSGPNERYPGRFDLLVRERRQASARFKPLVYQGLFIGQTAATLDQGESLLDVSTFYMYGITNRFTISTVGLANLVLPNVGLKYNVIRNDVFWYSPAVSLFFDPRSRSQVISFDQYLALPSMPKFISHTKISVVYSHVTTSASGAATKAIDNVSSALATSTEYVFSDWARRQPELHLDLGPSSLRPSPQHPQLDQAQARLERIHPLRQHVLAFLNEHDLRGDVPRVRTCGQIL